MDIEILSAENKFLRDTLVRICNAYGISESLVLVAMSKEGETYADTLVRLISELKDERDKIERTAIDVLSRISEGLSFPDNEVMKAVLTVSRDGIDKIKALKGRN